MNLFSFNIKLLVLFIITAGVIYLLADNKPLPEKYSTPINTPTIPYTIVKSSENSIPIFSRGKVSPAQIRHITSEVPGLVTFVSDNLIKGGLVQQNELLIQLDQQPFILDIAQKRSNLDQAELHFYETKAKAKVAKKGAGKNASDYALYLPQLRYANSQVEAASAALEYAKTQLEKTSIRAPITGKVITTKIHSGEYLHISQELAKIYGTGTVEVRLPLNDHQISLLGLRYNDEKPRVLIQNIQDENITWHGMITRSEGEKDKNQLLYVIATINNFDEKNIATKPLLPGSFIKSIIIGNLKTEFHALPRESLQAGDILWKISKENRLYRQAVNVIYRGKNKIYIDSGLKPEERIVIGSFSNLVEGLLIIPSLFNKVKEHEISAIFEAL